MNNERDIPLSRSFTQGIIFSIASSMGINGLDWAEDLRMSLGPEWLQECSDKFALAFFNKTYFREI
ncbi:MAG: hypothetical protein CM1200mP3_18790 [Chloroflexota bacterium]|nr:MAG: hypothetical protein CM1200mP3_18790 [Chloroflexota bacterium]